jgi:tRNA nucleotidyltransferase (CCA-adding enzyme)
MGQLVKTRQMMNELGYLIETGPIVMYFLTRRMSDKDTAEIQRMIPRRDFVDKWKHLESGAQDLAKRLASKEASMPSGAWKILSQAAPENLLFLTMTTRQQAVDQKLKNFFTKWRQVKEKLPFPEMAELRITPQLPEYPEITQKAFLLLLDGKLRSHTEIMNFLKPYEPPPPPPPPAPKRGRGKAAAAAASGGAPVPGKRGRKKKGSTADQPAPTPAEVPAAVPAPAQSAVPVPTPKKAGAPEPAKVGKKAVAPEPAKVGKKTVAPEPAKPAMKTAPPSRAAAKTPVKKVAPSKAVSTKKAPTKKAKAPARKVVAKKTAPAKKMAKKAAPKKGSKGR